MQLFNSIMIFFIAFIISHRIFVKKQVKEKLNNYSLAVNYYNLIIVSLAMLFFIFFEFAEQLLAFLSGPTHYYSASLGGILAALYLNVIPYLFKKKE